jgi:hypothetical protein
MTSRDFAYWLQGFLELRGPGPMTAEQVACVERHLAMVFIHEIDPSAGPPEHQAKLDDAHAPKPAPRVKVTRRKQDFFRC